MRIIDFKTEKKFMIDEFLMEMRHDDHSLLIANNDYICGNVHPNDTCYSTMSMQ